MANAFNISQIKSKLGWSNSFDRNAAFPLDINSWFGSYEEAVAAAATAVQVGSSNSKYYFGQQVYVFDGASAKTYLIQGDGTLQEIGSDTAPMIFVANEAAMLALTDIKTGQQVFREDTSTIWLFKGGDASDVSNWAESAAQNDTKWQNTDNKVNFYALTRASYKAITNKDANTLYFITDEGKIYKGSVQMTTSCIPVDTMPGVADAITNVLYLDKTTFGLQVTFDNLTWYVMSPGYLTDGANWATADSSKFATIGLIKKGITSAIESMNIKPAFDNKTGTVTVGDGADGAELTGVTHNPVYDSTQLKLTIPVYGGDDVVVNIPKDKFVTAGTYNAETQNIELTIEGQKEKVEIPAAALVDVYTPNNNDKNVTITISDTNEVSASIKIDPSASNALSYDVTNGFMVDVSSKLDKLQDAAGLQIVTSKTDGTIGESGISIKATGELGTSATEVPVASVIAAAISAAVNASSDDTKLDKVTGVVDNLVAFDVDGAIKDSGVKAGGAKLSETPDKNTLVTEAAVADIVSWRQLSST